MKKGLIIGFSLLMVVLLFGGVYYLFFRQDQQQYLQQDLQQGQRHTPQPKTDKITIYEEQQGVNSLLVGLWSEDSNPKHFKAYYDDACDESGYFWGKEWDEKDGVYEEDLEYHGNGWFKWSITDKEIVEIYVTDLNTMVVPIEYTIDQLNDSVYVHNEFKVAKTILRKNKKIPFRTFRYHRN